WTFVIFGTMHGIYMVGERWLFGKLGKELTQKPWFRMASGIVTFHFICFSLVFFAAESFDSALAHLGTLVQFTGGFKLMTPFVLSLIILGLVGNWVPKDSVKWWWQTLAARPVFVQAAILGLLFLLLGAMGPAGIAPFIFYQF